MKQLSKLLIVICLGIVFEASAYEWNQLTEIGVINKTVNPKNQKADKDLDFSDLEIKKKTLTINEVKNKFPALGTPKTVVILGDTGCRIKEGKLGSEYQDCNDSKAWPFWKIAEEAEKENPDLIIHLGDYHYREKCSAGKPCEKMSPVVGYGWKPWELDFFQPMQRLLGKAPIIIVRGNHEDCNRAFLGYKSLLANSEWEKDCVDYEPAQVMVLGDIAVINFDSSSISEIPFAGDEATWIKRFNEINEKIVRLKIKNVWMVTHKPIYGIIPFKFALVPGNINLRNYFEKSLLKDKVSVVFGGHIHTSMIVHPKKYAKQIILGNGGTHLDNFQVKITKSILSSFSYESANLVSSGFGYAILKKINDHSWTIIFKDSTGKESFRDTLSF
ncbi:MAG: metallophosphoesterase family protein [Bacteriovorax sp.]